MHANEYILFRKNIVIHIQNLIIFVLKKKRQNFAMLRRNWQNEFLGCDKPATNFGLLKNSYYHKTTTHCPCHHVWKHIIFIMPLWANFFINFHAYLQKEKIRTYFIVLILIMESSTKSVSFNYFFKFVLKCCYI